MDYLPITVQMKNKLCLIVGGGEVAARKLKHLLKAQSKVILLSESFSREVIELGHNSQVQLIQGSVNTHSTLAELVGDKLAKEVYLVIAATNNQQVNQTVSELARNNNLWVNVVDNLELSTFIMPAVIDRSPLLIAVSSSGISPVLARTIRENIEWLLPKSLGKLLDKLKLLRPMTKKKFSSFLDKRRFSEWFIDSAIKDSNLLAKDPADWLRDFQQRGKAQGKVYLVGAGPGSADLLTVKGLKLLQRADLVLYDALVSAEILDCIRKDAELICVGKRAGNHSVSQNETNSMLVNYARKGLSVIRLKGGDPFIFGRGGEELEYLNQYGIKYEVVPGITAASGCASYAGIPLTHRDYSQSVRFVTAHEKGNDNHIDWQSLALGRQTLVFYMGLMSNQLIASSLINNGRCSDTPVAVIQQGTTSQQRVVVTQLGNLPDAVAYYQVKTPALIVVGEVVQLANELSWFKQGELINDIDCNQPLVANQRY